MLHAAIDSYFRGEQSPLLMSDPVVEQALRRAHDQIEECALLSPSPNELRPLERWILALRLMLSARSH